MAQKSIHILNKNGYSMFWSSMWDEKINFSKSFKKKIFLNFFFNFLVEDHNSINLFKKNRFFLVNYVLSNEIFYLNSNFRKYIDIFEFKYRTEYFNSKIWLLKFHSWFLIFFFIFDLKENISEKFKKRHSNFSEVFSFYSRHLFYLNLKYKNFKLLQKNYF